MFQIRSNHRSCGDYRSRVYDASRAVGCGRGGWAAVGKLELHGGGQLGQAAITCTMRSPILHKGQHTVFVLGLLRRHHPLSVLDTVAFHSRETDGGPAFLFSLTSAATGVGHPIGPGRMRGCPFIFAPAAAWAGLTLWNSFSGRCRAGRL